MVATLTQSQELAPWASPDQFANAMPREAPITLKTDVQGNSAFFNTLQANFISPFNVTPGSINNQMLGPDVARDNLLVNGGFEIWQRTTPSFNTNGAWTSDRWQLIVTGSPANGVSKLASTIGSSGLSAQVGHNPVGGSTVMLQQPMNPSDYTQLLGKTVSFSILVKAVANSVRISIWDSVNADRYSSYNVQNNPVAGELLTITAQIASNATGVAVRIWEDSVIIVTAEINDAMLVVGTQPANYATLTPADDLARCARYYRKWGPAPTANFEFCSGQAYSGIVGGASLYISASGGSGGMPIAPTITMSAIADFCLRTANGTPSPACTALTAGVTMPMGIIAISWTVPSGMVAGNATALFSANTNASIVAEANP